MTDAAPVIAEARIIAGQGEEPAHWLDEFAHDCIPAPDPEVPFHVLLGIPPLFEQESGGDTHEPTFEDWAARIASLP